MSTRGASASESSLTRNFTNERAGERAAPLRTGRPVNQIFRLENTFKLREQSSRCIYIMKSCNYFKQWGRFCFPRRRISLKNTMVAGTSCFESRSEKGSERKIPRHCKGEERSSGAKRRGAPHHQPSRQGATETWSGKCVSKTGHYSGGHLASSKCQISLIS